MVVRAMWLRSEVSTEGSSEKDKEEEKAVQAHERRSLAGGGAARDHGWLQLGWVVVQHSGEKRERCS